MKHELGGEGVALTVRDRSDSRVQVEKVCGVGS